MDSECDGADDRIVHPPGGPRPASSVHAVSPGERVRQLADGTFVIEPVPADIDKDVDDKETE